MNLKHSILDKITTLKDGSVKITLITQELSPHQLAELFMSINKEIACVDIPEDTTERKTKSQRLKAVLYRVWEQAHQSTHETSELFYASEMEKIINHYKDKLS